MTAEFEPTRLYIKELAGVKYFGKTTKLNVHSYPGSGVIWKKRIKKYGKKNIKTLWVSDWYYDPVSLSEFALRFSEDNQIVESKEWANYIPENGLDGNTSNAAKALWSDPTTRDKLMETRKSERNGRYDPTIHSFTHDTGKIFEGTMLDFKRNNPHISNGKVSQLVSGKRKSVYGWRLSSTDKSDVGQSSVRKKLTDNSVYTFIHESGKVVEYTRTEFRTSICVMARGCVNEIVNEGKTRKGWSLKK